MKSSRFASSIGQKILIISTVVPIEDLLVAISLQRITKGGAGHGVKNQTILGTLSMDAPSLPNGGMRSITTIFLMDAFLLPSSVPSFLPSYLPRIFLERKCWQCVEVERYWNGRAMGSDLVGGGGGGGGGFLHHAHMQKRLRNANPSSSSSSSFAFSSSFLLPSLSLSLSFDRPHPSSDYKRRHRNNRTNERRPWRRGRSRNPGNDKRTNERTNAVAGCNLSPYGRAASVIWLSDYPACSITQCTAT